jgi:hypothetical protein
MVSHKNWKKPEKGRQSWSGPFRTKMRPSRKKAEEQPKEQECNSPAEAWLLDHLEEEPDEKVSG